MGDETSLSGSTSSHPFDGSDMSERLISPEDRILIAGHRGLVGSALMRRFSAAGYGHLLTTGREECDLGRQDQVERWFETHRPDVVLLAAGKVGGIHANATYPADFLYQNLMIHANVVHAAYRTGVRRLLYLGSSCIYPREAPQPIREEALLTGTLEPTNEPYALAKIAGIRMCDSYRRQFGCDFFSAMPTNLYGPNDNFDLQNSHVLPALIRKFHEARAAGNRQVTVWGTGTVRRELLHVDDLADACRFLLENYRDGGHINVGTGEDLTIRELAETVAEIVHPEAELVWDTSKPDGTPRKQMDVTRVHSLGWRHTIALRDGIRSTYDWYLKHVVGRERPAEPSSAGENR